MTEPVRSVTLPLFPCDPHDKRPLTRHGFKDATTNPVVLGVWEREYRTALWATPIPAGVFVVDVDPRHGGDHSLAGLVSEHGPLPATRTTRTRSGGQHLWFATSEQVRQDQSGRCLGPGLDTRCHGRGYVIVPPSRGYVWLDDRPIVDAPGWLVDRLRPAPQVVSRDPVTTDRYGHRRYVDAAIRGECDLVRACPAGHGLRNVTLHRAACRLGQLVGAGLLDDDRASRELFAATSLPDREAAATIRSGMDWGRDHPRGPVTPPALQRQAISGMDI